jgi:hypothetical protein
MKTAITIPVLAVSLVLVYAPSGADGFDFDTGNAAVEIVIPTVAPVIFTEVSPTGGDATLVLRVTTMTTNAWFDATAPYHPTAVGVYTRLDRRPAAKSSTNGNMNTALLYASYHVFMSLLPEQEQIWRKMLTSVGLDPDADADDPDPAIRLGILGGTGVVQGRQNDGMNQLGFDGGQLYNPAPYRDYTGYVPVNTANTLKNPSRWQPDLQRQGMGLYKVQQFVTPQYAFVEPYSFADASAFSVPPPINSKKAPKFRYTNQADEVLQASASLTEEQKLKAELFDNKIESLGFSAVFAAQSRGLSLLDFIHLDFLTNMAAFDAGIVVWQEKRRYDAVRPFSAIRHIYGDEPVTAWGGPGQGTVFDLPATEWKSYLEEADHPEYPSGSACFCAAHAQAARLFLGTDDLTVDGAFPGFVVERPAGSSRIEPGVTPAIDTSVVFPSWTQFAADCGQSRVWAGVHFQSAVDESFKLCNVFGENAYDYVNALIDGVAPVRGPSQGRF